MKSRRLFWQVVGRMEELIDNGTYPPGSRLPTERELVETFNVSRPTVREAIIALEVLERVEVKTGAGVYVTEKPQPLENTTKISAYELTQARALIEGEATALAATTICDSELDTLAQTLEDMENNVNPDNANRVFHLTISNATRNKAMIISVANLWSLLDSSKHIQQAFKEIGANKDQNNRLEEHRAIYHALKNKDAIAARAAMHQHFNRLINALFDASEAKALEEIKKKTTEKRGLYSLDHLVNV